MPRSQLNISGQVQGVGFRPFIYRLAHEENLTGFVYNTSEGVRIEIQGKCIKQFKLRLMNEAPDLASITTITETILPDDTQENQFVIKLSETHHAASTIPADHTICDDCLNDLFTPTSPYFLYPFISCTNCGPRFSIIKSMPYDRDNTSMEDFELCDSCTKTYRSPKNRHFHAETIACPVCGPSLSHTPETIANALLEGEIIAIKNLGGYQFICDANNQSAVYKLREIKKRPDKPFALMMLNTASTEAVAKLSAQESSLLNAPERPIVICYKQSKDNYIKIAPQLNTIGLMLPSTPLHYLLFYYLLQQPQHSNWLQQANSIKLIVTSANKGGAPMVIDDHDAKAIFNNKINFIVRHQRAIKNRLDDTVIRVIANKTCFIRRARGYVPKSIMLPEQIPSVLALGGYLKNTICVTKGDKAYLSQPIGDLNHKETLKYYKSTISDMLSYFSVKPTCIAIDKLPDYYGATIAEEFDLPIIKIQHHHAHLAACAVDNQLTGEAIGLALDGVGYEEQGENWGGELFHYQTQTFKRVSSLKPIMQPGGDIAVKQIWRMAVSILFELGLSHEIQRFCKKRSLMENMIHLLQCKKTPKTSSCARLFDAAAAIADLGQITSYEGQAASTLESQVSTLSINNQGWLITDNQLDLLPLFNTLITCDNSEKIANIFHGTLIEAIAKWVYRASLVASINKILLSGGCFQNKILAEGLSEKLKILGLKPMLHSQVSPNDSGLSLGQAWVAGKQLLEQ